MQYLYEQRQLPVLQNRVYSTKEEAKLCPRGDVRLVEDDITGLVYNAAFDPSLLTYDENYQNEQGLSKRFQSHLKDVADIIEAELGANDLVEVGCGKGLFLELLQERGVGISGFDPTYEGDNPKVFRHFFEPGVDIEAHGLILRHVLEHIQNPFGFLTRLRDAMGGDGQIYIEVPSFDWICQNKTWFDIFYEHVNYFRLSDFHRMFSKVRASGRLFGGQYLFIVAELASLRIPELNPNDQVQFPADFCKELDRLKTSPHHPSAVWGAASKGVIFSVMSEHYGRPVSVAIDINPVKQGRFLPVTGVKVLSPEQAYVSLPKDTTVYVMNSNYLEEIVSMSGGVFNCVPIDGVSDNR